MLEFLRQPNLQDKLVGAGLSRLSAIIINLQQPALLVGAGLLRLSVVRINLGEPARTGEMSGVRNVDCKSALKLKPAETTSKAIGDRIKCWGLIIILSKVKSEE